MRTKAKLSQAVEEAFLYLSQLPDIVEVEVFASSNAQNVFRIDYKSHILCNGGEEAKSKEDYGIGVQAIFKTADGIKIGFGSESNNLSLEGAKIALEKAREGAVPDNEFVSLPKTIELKRTLYDYHDPEMLELSEKDFIAAGWKILDGAIKEFLNSETLKKLALLKNKPVSSLGLIVGGDMTVVAESIAVASTSMPEIQTDESTFVTVQITAMVEKFDAKGSGYGSYAKLSKIDDKAGKEAAQNAIDACGVIINGEIQKPLSIASGTYPVIFGPQPVSELMSNLIIPSLGADAFWGLQSPFTGQFGKQVVSSEINIFDDAANPEYVGAKGITCEGLPTKRTELIKAGVLNDILSNWYETQRLLHKDPEAEKKLGKDPKELYRQGKLFPTSGFRFNRGGGRGYDATAGISGTNTVFEGTNPKNIKELVADVPFGIYIGRIWYCYPMNGLKAGDFTATVIADSFVIKDGKIMAPLKANAVRINDNIMRVLNSVKAVSNGKKASIIWAADEVAVACDILVSDVTLEEIGAEEAPPTGV